MKVLLAAFAALWLSCLQAIAAPADTTAQFSPETGLFVIRHHTVEVAKANFVFWAGKWEWRGLTLAAETRAPFDAQFGDGRQKQIAVSYESGSYRLSLDASLGTYWIVLRDTP